MPIVSSARSVRCHASIVLLILFVLPSSSIARAAVRAKPARQKSDRAASGDEPADRDREQRAGGPSRALVAASSDPDAPGAIDRDEYVRRREAYDKLRRGLPLPPGREHAREEAIRQMEAQELKAYGKRAQSQFLPANRQPLLNGTSWSPVGPAPIPNGQTEGTSLAVSGRVTCIAVHPTNANIVYVGTAAGGLYRTLDGGTSWTAMMDGALTLAIGAVAIDPLTPSTIVVGTGEGSSGGDFFGVGLYKITSADGVSPAISGPFNLDGSSNDVFTGNSITKVLISPTDDNIVFVSTTYGTGGRGQDSPLSPPSRGLYRSTNFMGASPTFAKIALTTANGGNRRVTDMVFDPSDPNTIILNVGGNANVNNVPDGGFYRITSALGGSPVVTQTLNIGGIKNAKFAVNKVGQTVTVYAATEENSCSGADGTLRRSTDGGQTWPTVLPAAGGFCGGQCWYNIGLSIDPTNASNVLLGGQYDDTGANPCRSSTQLKSTDGGTTFNRADTGLHPDTHAIVHAPSNPSIVYAGNDGGIFKSVDGGGSWTSLNNSGFSATQFYSFRSHPLDRTFGIGGTQDNGTNMLQFNGSWTRADYGDGGFALVDRNADDRNPLLLYHTYYNQTNSIIGFGRASNVNDAHDFGWLFLGYGGYANGLGNDPTTLFFAPMASGPGNPSTVYFGTDRLYRSANGGVTMAVVSQAPINGAAITTIAVSPQTDNARIVGLQDGSVFVTTSGSSTLTDVTGTLPVAFTGAVAFDPNDANVAWVTYSGYGITHVWKNTNVAGGAANWVARSSGLPDVPVNAIAIDPRNSSNVWIGTDIGVYASTDGGLSWNPFGTGLPRVPVFALDIQDQSRVLRAATHGRGIWEISISGTVLPALSVGTITTVPSVGNGNAVLEPGETGAITIQVTNHGIVTATGVTATLTTATGGVTIATSASPLPNIAAGAVASNSLPLAFTTSSLLTCGTALQFTVTINATGAAPAASAAFKVPLGSPASPSTFAYAGPAVPIPDDNPDGAAANLVVSGVTGPISNVTVTIGGSACSTAIGSTTVGIDHSWAEDLSLSLLSPSGTVVPLTLSTGGNGHNMCGTTFSDAAATAFSTLTSAAAPFTGTFRPLSPLSVLAGETANGTWQVKAVDGYNLNTGNIRAFSISISTASCAPFVPAPASVSATATSASSVTVDWTTVAGADHYEIYRGTTLSGLTASVTPIATVTAPPYPDGGLTGGISYLYRVRALSGATTSPYSAVDPATTIVFADPSLAGVPVQAVHMTQLRSAVTALCNTVGVTPAYTNSIAAGVPIRAQDVIDLRTALLAARNALSLSATFSDDPLSAGTRIKAVHLQEIRDAVK